MANFTDESMRDIFLTTIGYTSNETKGFHKYVIASIGTLAVVGRADRAKLLWKVSAGLSRWESLLGIGFCIAMVFRVLVYKAGNIPILYLDSYISKVNNVQNLTGIFITCLLNLCI